MKKTILPFATLAVASFALIACGNGGNNSSTPTDSSITPSSQVDSSVVESVIEESSEEIIVPARPLEAFALGEKGTAGSFDLFSSYQLNLYKDNVYEFLTTQITFGYSMVLGTTVTANYGTYVLNGTEDGVTTYTLNKASEVVLSSYSLAGGYKIHINTADEAQVYPTELPAKTQGEKSFAQNKDDVINAYGLGTKVYTNNHILSFTDPNGEGDAEKAVIETASGSVASVLNKAFKQVQVVSSKAAAAVGDAYNVNYLHIFEDDSYEYFTTNITYGYSMVLGTTNTVAFGQGEYGRGEDGFTPFTLSKADDAVLNSYSLAGGFSIAINTASADQVYPAELPAKTQGEKTFAQNKDDVINAYGESFQLFTSDDSCVMSLEDPNAE